MNRALAGVAALALALVAAVAAVNGTPPAPASVEQSEGCPRDYPTLIAAGNPYGTLHSRALSGLVVCTEPHGTATLVITRTDAVWLLEETADVALHRLSTSTHSRSFLALAAGPRPAIPSGAAVIIPTSPSDLRLTIDPELTLAQLAHDELASSLAVGTRNLPVLDRIRGVLSVCLRSLVADIGSPEAVLETASPAPMIIEAAERLAARDDRCAAVWQAAGGDSLAEDVAAWRRHSGFVVRAMSAAVVYTALSHHDW